MVDEHGALRSFSRAGDAGAAPRQAISAADAPSLAHRRPERRRDHRSGARRSRSSTALDHGTAMSRKPIRPRQERRHRHLVGGVQYSRGGAALPQGEPGQAAAPGSARGPAARSRGRERAQRSRRGAPVREPRRASPAYRRSGSACRARRAGPAPSRRVKATRLCTIDCGWTSDLDPVLGHAEQMMGLDHLEALVHHRGAVDADLGAHGPVGVAHRLLGRRAAPSRPRVQPRNGPPEAVRISRSTPRRLAAGQRLEDRVVLGIDRQQRGAAARRTSRMNRAPAQTRHSLLASATMAPRRTAASVGPQPGGADDAAMTHSAGRARRLDQPPRPGRDLDPAAGERVLAARGSRPDRRSPRGGRRGRRAMRRERVGAAAARSPPRPGRARAPRRSAPACSAPIEPVAPRMVTLRGGSADGAGCRHGRLPAAGEPDQAARTPARRSSSPSTRSSRPPWPGIRWPLSLTPARRLSADSNRSPTWRDDRQHGAQAAAGEPAAGAEQPARRAPPISAGPDHAAAEAGPGLARADPRRQASGRRRRGPTK